MRADRACHAEACEAREGGFSLLEVLVATTILTSALAALAQLFAVSANANMSAKATSYASVLAQDKMEQLRGFAFGFDELGAPITDGLSPSPAGALNANVDGYCDFLDKYGNSLGTGRLPPSGTVFIRRWSMEPRPGNPDNTLVFQVLVISRVSHREEVRIVSVKTRKAK